MRTSAISSASGIRRERLRTIRSLAPTTTCGLTLGSPPALPTESVFILDPACGTGTYLGAVLRSIHNIHISNGEPPEVALSRTIDAATSRLIGFEILPAAFVISHLHIGRLLSRLGAGELPDRLRVYLTNSLTGWPPNSPPEGLTLF